MFISYLHFSFSISMPHQEPPNPVVSQHCWLLLHLQHLHCCSCSVGVGWIYLRMYKLVPFLSSGKSDPLPPNKINNCTVSSTNIPVQPGGLR